MSGEEGRRGTVSRRDFVKVTSTVLGATALASAAQPVMKTLAADFSAGQVEAQGEEIFSVVCRPNCFGACHINAHVRDGKLVKTSMAPFANAEYNRICLRGLSHVQRMYDPDRIKYPMKRAGERGSGQWERISWDEAVDLIAEKFTAIQGEYGKQAVSFWACSGNMSVLSGGTCPNLLMRLRNLMGATDIENSVDMAQSHGQSRVIGGNYASSLDDIKNAKTIMLWGYNATEATIHTYHFIAEAQEAGVKLVVVDPNRTKIAMKADKWVSIRPATDAALALGCMNVIVNADQHDKRFLLDHTVAPFLVRQDNGLFLRMSDLGVAPTEGPINPYTGQPTMIDLNVVWDPASAGPKQVGTVADPALEGSFTVGGVKVNTAFTLLRAEIDKYPLEVVTKLTELDVETIQEIAQMFVDGGVSQMWGYGNQAYSNGVQVGTSLTTLAAITGNFGYPGASSGGHWKFYPGYNWGDYVAPTFQYANTVSNLALPEVLASGTFRGGDYPIKALWIHAGNPLNCAPNTNQMLTEVWPKLDFIVTSEITFTTTALHSDLVLPVPHFFEQEEILASGEHGFMLHSQKATEPLFEAKSDADAARLVAAKLGFGEHFTKTDAEELSNGIKSAYSESLGITYERLKEEQCMLDGSAPAIPAQSLTFATPSGRIEFYCENPVPRKDYGQAFNPADYRMPRFYPPSEAWPENEKFATYPLILMSERPRFRVHSQWYGVPWLRELDPEPIVKMNPIDAGPRGIKNGDYVECFNDRGRAVAKAVLSEANRPGVLIYPKGWEPRQHKVGSWSELVTSYPDPDGVNGNFMDNLVEVRLWNEEQ